jgi:AcrR family transcriptional regulator
MARTRSIDDQHILTVAREVFTTDGAQGSTREIARRLGVSEGTLFQRFPTKVALFLAAMTPSAPETEVMLKKARSLKDTRKALKFVGTFILDYFRTAIPLLLPLITHPGVGIGTLLSTIGQSPAAAFHDAVAAFIVERRDTGALRSPEPSAAAGLVVAAMHSIALFEVTGLHGGAAPEKVVHAMLDTLWHGLEPDSRPADISPPPTRGNTATPGTGPGNRYT